MGDVRSIATIKLKLEDIGKNCMFLGYAQNHTGVTYRMLNLRTKNTVLSCGILRKKKTYGEYISRKANTKADTYMLQYEE